MEREGQDIPGDPARVAATRAGSAPAFAALVERYQAPLRRTLARLVGDPELAADLAQDTFEAAFRGLDRLADDGRFAPWLYAIARNRWRAAERRRRLRRVVSLDWLLAREAGGGTFASAGDLAAEAAERDAVQRALARLRPSEREALLLQGVWGFTCREVAALLAITPAARQRLARAKRAFRAHYQGPAHETEKIVREGCGRAAERWAGCWPQRLSWRAGVIRRGAPQGRAVQLGYTVICLHLRGVVRRGQRRRQFHTGG